MSYDLEDTARLSDVHALGVKVVKLLGDTKSGVGYSVTLATTSWLAPTGGEPDPASDYSYRCFIPATSLGQKLTSDNRVDVIFDDETLKAIQDNQDDMCPISVTTEDGVYIFTNTKPVVAYNACLWVMNGSSANVSVAL